MKPAPGGDTPSTKKVVSPQGASDEGGRCLQAEQRTNPLRQAADHHIVVVMQRDAALDLQQQRRGRQLGVVSGARKVLNEELLTNLMPGSIAEEVIDSFGGLHVHRQSIHGHTVGSSQLLFGRTGSPVMVRPAAWSSASAMK